MHLASALPAYVSILLAYLTSLVLCLPATTFNITTASDDRNDNALSIIPFIKCKTPISADHKLLYTRCRTAALQFQQRFLDNDAFLTHKIDGPAGSIRCPYTLNNGDCVFEVDYVGRQDPPIFPSTVSMYGAQLAKECRWQAGGGVFKLEKENYVGEWKLILRLSHPELIGQGGDDGREDLGSLGDQAPSNNSTVTEIV